jgi:hypothetical protein
MGSQYPIGKLKTAHGLESRKEAVFGKCYTPETWAELEQVYVRACIIASIAVESKQQREEMALLILLASELYDDEQMLVNAAFRLFTKDHNSFHH